MKKIHAPIVGLLSSIAVVTFVAPAEAAINELIYQHGDQIYKIEQRKAWRGTIDIPTYKGKPIAINVGSGETLPQGITMRTRNSWNANAIQETLEELIAPKINREKGDVTIDRDDKDNVIFTGTGFTGRKLDTVLAAELTMLALDNNVTNIRLPVETVLPIVTVKDKDLRKQGIQELIAIGESDYSGSPRNRRHNIAVGLSKFNGYILPAGEEFSFNDILGPVDGEHGYTPELTIVGPKTIPEFGGGLCQVSTTAFRGAWGAGFPITERRNHSFAVSYYAPAGTDATIYPPYTNFRFENTTENSILIQTYTDGNNAYYFYYGTPLPETQHTVLFGPFIWDTREPPPDRIEYTPDLPPGEKRPVGKAVTGMKAMWYRLIGKEDTAPEYEEYYSLYEARPNFEEVGIGAEELDSIFLTPDNNTDTENNSPESGYPSPEFEDSTMNRRISEPPKTKRTLRKENQ